MSEADLTELADAVVATEADIASIKCVLHYISDRNQVVNRVDADDVAEANSACGI